MRILWEAPGNPCSHSLPTVLNQQIWVGVVTCLMRHTDVTLRHTQSLCLQGQGGYTPTLTWHLSLSSPALGEQDRWDPCGVRQFSPMSTAYWTTCQDTIQLHEKLAITKLPCLQARWHQTCLLSESIWPHTGFCNVGPGIGHLNQNCVFDMTSVTHVTFQAVSLNIRHYGYQIWPFTNSSLSHIYDCIYSHTCQNPQGVIKARPLLFPEC